MLRKVYLTVGALMLVGYAVTAVAGWEWRSTEKQLLPASARQSPGGYRSFHFWHSGFHGGK